MVTDSETNEGVMVACVRTSNSSYIECSVTWGVQRATLFFAADTKLTSERIGDALVCVLLLPAMATGAELHVQAPVSAGLLGNVEQLQDVFHTWWKKLARVSIVAKTNFNATTVTHTSLSFFTGGVDSFYSAVTVRPELGALAFVEGFDIRLENQLLTRAVKKRLELCARDLSVPLRTVRTNYRDFLKMDSRFPNWGQAHGGALACIAHLLGHSSVIVPAGSAYNELRPWGSHPLTDPLWSSDDIKLVHHGAAENRFTKCCALGENAAAMRNLRVCWENRDGAYNCGHCEKCIRTMLNLYAAGLLHKFESFPDTLSPEVVARVKLRNKTEKHDMKKIHALLTEMEDADPNLREAVRNLLYPVKVVSRSDLRATSHRRRCRNWLVSRLPSPVKNVLKWLRICWRNTANWQVK